jgi:hypothetical protein
MWNSAAISFDLDDELTVGSIGTLLVRSPAGEIRIMGEVLEFGRRVHVVEVHISGASSNVLGRTGLWALARAFAETFDVDEILVEGAARTTGARPGHRPRAFHWRRGAGQLHAAPELP